MHLVLSQQPLHVIEWRPPSPHDLLTLQRIACMLCLSVVLSPSNSPSTDHILPRAATNSKVCVDERLEALSGHFSNFNTQMLPSPSLLDAVSISESDFIALPKLRNQLLLPQSGCQRYFQLVHELSEQLEMLKEGSDRAMIDRIELANYDRILTETEKAVDARFRPNTITSTASETTAATDGADVVPADDQVHTVQVKRKAKAPSQAETDPKRQKLEQ